jgi:predicted RNA binding protein YcfA (HicA-like mRNA interferase family)
MKRFIEVNAGTFQKFLEDKGFVKTKQGNEIVYYRRHNYNKNVIVKVYTSIKIGADVARDVGKDAIRIVTIFDNGNKNFPIAKMPRVYRTGSQDAVQERALSRMREAYVLGTKWIKNSK